MKLTKSQYLMLAIFASLLVILALPWDANNQEKNSLAGFIEKANLNSERSDEFKRMLAPISDVSSSDLLLDISEDSTRHIEDSIIIPYTNFIGDDDLPKSVLDIAQILGNAGISRNDSIVIYGECMPCGGGPAPATYIYWMLKCLGHENVSVLDGTIEDWAATGLPITNESTFRPHANYTPMLISDIIGSYDYVMSGKATIVDARPYPEFNASTIPGSINIPYDSVLENSTIKNETALKEVFANISMDKPVVVFTVTGVKASVVWFTMKMLGYDAKLYSWQNWLVNRAATEKVNEGNLTLERNELTPINSFDLVSGKPVSNNISATYNGYIIGFCCEASRSDWVKMSEAEKDALLRDHPA